MKHDIATHEDIQLLADTFYGNIRENELLGPIFNGILNDRWPAHLEKMYRFWQTILLHEYSYHGAPFPPHAKMSIEQQHFETWVGIWHNTIDNLFAGEKADEAKWRGDKMATLFLSKINYFRNTPSIPLI